jgi:hypothetical protein
MWVDFNTLDTIAKLAQDDDKLLSMLVEWNETSDWGQQDMVMSKIMNYVKDKLPTE